MKTLLEIAMLKEIQDRRRHRQIRLNFIRRQKFIMALKIIAIIWFGIIIWAILAPFIALIWGYRK